MLTAKHMYCALLAEQSARWIERSLRQPSECMTATHMALHALVLRARGVPAFQKQATALSVAPHNEGRTT